MSRMDPNATGATIPIVGQATIELGSRPAPAMPQCVAELVEAAEAGAAYATYVHGGRCAAEQIEIAIASVRAYYGVKP